MREFISALWQNVATSFRDGKGPARWVVMGTGGAVVVLFLGWLIFAKSAEDFLDVPDLSEAQIRRIATELLLSENPIIRERAAAKLTSAGSKSVPVLDQVVLELDDLRLSEAALCVLLSVDRNAAAKTIESLMANADVEVRRMAVRSAGTCDDPKMAAILSKALRDADSGVRLAAANGMARQKSRTGVADLERMLKDQNPTVRRHAARALQNLTGRDYSQRARAPQ